MAKIFEKYREEAAHVAMDETINFSEKIAPFLNPKLMLQKEALICLHETMIDNYNCHVLYKFLQVYGLQDIEIATVQGGSVLVTCLQAELEREAPELLEKV